MRAGWLQAGAVLARANRAVRNKPVAQALTTLQQCPVGRLGPTAVHSAQRRALFTAQPHSDSKEDEISPAALTKEQKKILFVSAAVPMIGFGFMDNLVMITMGEFIDSTMGVTFGLSTLTAAGFGQIFSDISGICFGGTVEAVCTKMGLPTAKLTSAQAAMGQTKRTTTFGAMCGVTVGCLLGMSILLFKSDETEDRKHDAEFSKMLEADNKQELLEYVSKIKTELAQAEAALVTTETTIVNMAKDIKSDHQAAQTSKALGDLKRWRSNSNISKEQGRSLDAATDAAIAELNRKK
eukprot:CAMPEP_0173057432 /NCGR_PEP_ID=MMETSP1102-20130122/738_1 /TAXON_ID=49646 /ORGANISM="Geminigera sp., Strain Caron Lab Isolate" /LENGTH=294 /DNA_ID=CAMNT_0013922949 /DNA_START=1 /DNA_END=885 /DNA_ORIENTATION=+